MRPPTIEKPPPAQASRRILPDLLAEVSGGGFASSPDVPASPLGPGIVYSLHAGYRVKCETSGLGRRLLPPHDSPQRGMLPVIRLPDHARQIAS